MKEYIAEAEKDLLHTYNLRSFWIRAKAYICMTPMGKNIWIS